MKQAGESMNAAARHARVAVYFAAVAVLLNAALLLWRVSRGATFVELAEQVAALFMMAALWASATVSSHTAAVAAARLSGASDPGPARFYATFRLATVMSVAATCCFGFAAYRAFADHEPLDTQVFQVVLVVLSTVMIWSTIRAPRNLAQHQLEHPTP